MKRYSVQLLFKYVGCNKEHGRWLCESRIITILADSPSQAFDEATEYGRDESIESIEFVGITKIICCDLILGNNETWYEMITHKTPEKLIPAKEYILKNV